jgi:hypothetical protein
LKTTPVAAPPLKKGGSPNEGCRQAGPYTFLGLYLVPSITVKP